VLEPSALPPYVKEMETEKIWFTGQLLLALPGMGDPRFEQAVIVMVSHDEEGAMGIGVGKTLRGMTVGDVMDQLKIPHDDKLDIPVYFGGPVEPSRGFVIHSLDWGGSGAVQIADRWMISSSHDILRAIAEGRGPSRWLVALGYAGWEAGQLEGEMVQHGWHIAEGSDELLFDTEAERKWSRAYADSGVDTRLLTLRGGQA
jgi:putative transcriptional regulator